MKFDGICLKTHDVLALADFYSRALGVQYEGDAQHAEVLTEGAHLAIFSIPAMEGMAPGSMQSAGTGYTTLGFEVADVDAEYERIKTMGVEFVLLPKTHPWGARSFWFRDSYGNMVNFFAKVECGN